MDNILKYPISCIVNKVVPKTMFYKFMEVNTRMKGHFVDDVGNFIWLYKIAPSTLNVSGGKSVNEISIFAVNLKKKLSSFDVFTFIDKYIPRHVVFILIFENERCLLVNYKEKVQSGTNVVFRVVESYKSEWISSDALSLPLQGANMDILFDNIIRHVAGEKIVQDTSNLKDDIDKSLEQNEVKNQIALLKSKILAEKQPQKKFLLHKKLKEIETKLIH